MRDRGVDADALAEVCSPAALLEGLAQNWRRRIVALESFERELRATREEARRSMEGSEVDDVDDMDHDDHAATAASAHDDEGARLGRFSGDEARPRRARTPAKRRASALMERDGAEDDASDDSEDMSLRALLGHAVNETTSRRNRRIERQAERQQEVDDAFRRRDAGIKIVRAGRRWYARRLRKIIRLQSTCRRWLALRKVAMIQSSRALALKAGRRWRTTCETRRRIRACVRIQQAWRTRKLRNLLRQDAARRHRVQRRVEEIVRQYMERRERAKRTHAVIKIQRTWRAFIRERLLMRQKVAVLDIQRVWRGARARNALRHYRELSARREAIERDLSTVDESDFMDIDEEENSLSDVFATIQHSKSHERALEVEDSPQVAPALVETRSGASASADVSVASGEYYVRHRRRFIRDQKRRLIQRDLQRNADSRLARFRSNVARARS